MTDDLFQVRFSDQTGNALVGGYVPQPIADYLKLLSLYHKTSVTNLLRDMINERKEKSEPEDMIIRVLAARAYKQWKVRARQSKGYKNWKTSDDIIARFREFESEVKFRLYKRNIPEPKIIEILQEMEHMYFHSVGGIDAED